MDVGLIALYKHWISADAVKQFVGAKVPMPANGTLPGDVAELAQFYSTFLRLSVWYALLYVVVEGYGEQSLRDPDVDALLAEGTFVDLLRRFRNAVFHYQEDPFSEKLTLFLTEPRGELWVKDLNSSLETFFRRNLPIDEFVNQMQSRR